MYSISFSLNMMIDFLYDPKVKTNIKSFILNLGLCMRNKKKIIILSIKNEYV